jgi:small-conductance mechanosensitive channel
VTEQVWDWAIGVPLQILLILVIAVITQILLSMLNRRAVRRAAERPRIERLAHTRQAARSAQLSQALLSERAHQRSAAIGGLIRNIIAIAVWTIAFLMILSLLDINITPVIASASVIGLAVGFGAQTMIKDYLSGILIILEDQYGIGDMVDVGPVVGVVEEVALRFTRLRDDAGVVWYVRNGEILHVANRSQGWNLAVVEIPIAFDEDTDRVRDIVESVSTDIDEDPSHHHLLLSRPTLTGVEPVTEDTAVVRITAKSAPDAHLHVARTIRERVEVALEHAGIRRPVTEVPADPGPTTSEATP